MKAKDKTTPPPSPIEEALKACPFCGSREVDMDKLDGSRYWRVMCGTSFRCGNGPWRDSKTQAIAAWNRRAQEKAVEGLVEEARWRTMGSAPKDGKQFLIRYPNQGNLVALCYWVHVHLQWRSNAEVIFPYYQGCEWLPIPAALAAVREAKGEK